MAATVTLTTDFGWRDPYVAAMKGVLINGCPDIRIVDLTHEIAPQDVLEGALFLAAAVPFFPPGTIHLAVVDPGVGSERRAIAARLGGQIVVCPDNGLLTLLERALSLEAVHVIASHDFMRAERSATFHGRDVFAPAAARLAGGTPLAAAGPAVVDLVRIALPSAVPLAGGVRGEVIHIDRFGNAITNVTRDDLPGQLDAPQGKRSPATSHSCVAGGRRLPLGRTYSDVARGEPLALIGSSGLLEVAVNGGSAAQLLGLRRGSEVRVEASVG